MADELYYVARDGESPKLAIGIVGAYTEFQAVLGEQEPPPLSVFEDQWSESWFKKLFGVVITPAVDLSLVEKLEEVQAEYTDANRQAKRLKAEREQLTILALFSGYDVESIVDASGQAPVHIDNLLSNDSITKAVVGERELPQKTVGEMEFLIQRKAAEDTKTRIRSSGPKGSDEQRWFEKYNQLKSYDNQRRESKKANNGDEWRDVECTSEEYEELQKLVDAWFG